MLDGRLDSQFLRDDPIIAFRSDGCVFKPPASAIRRPIIRSRNQRNCPADPRSLATDRPLATSTVRVAAPSEKAVKKGAATAAKNWAGIDRQTLCFVRGAIP